MAVRAISDMGDTAPITKRRHFQVEAVAGLRDNARTSSAGQYNVKRRRTEVVDGQNGVLVLTIFDT